MALHPVGDLTSEKCLNGAGVKQHVNNNKIVLTLEESPSYIRGFYVERPCVTK